MIASDYLHLLFSYSLPSYPALKLSQLDALLEAAG